MLRVYSGFAHLLGAGVLVRLLWFALLPLATRVFAPQAFAAMAWFMSALSVIAVVATLRLELTIPGARTHEDALRSSRLALMCSLAISAGLCVVLLSGYGTRFALSSGWPLSVNWLYVLPVAVLLNSILLVRVAHMTRDHQLPLISLVKVVQGVAIAGCLVALMLRPAGASLVIAQTGGLLFGAAAAWWFSTWSTRSETSTPTDYDQPVSRSAAILNTVPAAMDAAAVALPVLMVGWLYAPADLEQYGFTRRLLGGLAALASAAGYTTILAHASRAVREGRPIWGDIKPIVLLFTASATVMLLVVLLGGGPLFAFVFGETWRASGDLARFMIPATALQLVATALSAVLVATGRFGLLSLWQIASLVVIGTLALAGALRFEHWVALVSAAEFSLYAAYIAVSVYALRQSVVAVDKFVPAAHSRWL
jgi:O-antigen/teichoic acid export membrane protein